MGTHPNHTAIKINDIEQCFIKINIGVRYFKGNSKNEFRHVLKAHCGVEAFAADVLWKFFETQLTSDDLTKEIYMLSPLWCSMAEQAQTDASKNLLRDLLHKVFED